MKVSAVQTFTISVLLMAVFCSSAASATKLRGAKSAKSAAARSIAIEYEESDPLVDTDLIIIPDEESEERNRDLQVDPSLADASITVTNVNGTITNSTGSSTISGAQEATGTEVSEDSKDDKGKSDDKGKGKDKDDKDDVDGTVVEGAEEADMDDPDDEDDEDATTGGNVGSTAGAANCPPGSNAVIATESGEIFCTGGGGDDRRRHA